MTDIQIAKKRRLSNEEDSEGESSSKWRRYSPDKERSRSSSHSKRHKSRRESDEERRSRKRHRHRKEKTESSSSQARTSKRRSSSRERRRNYRRSSHSREKDATNSFNTSNGRYNSVRERSPRENHFTRRNYSPPGYRDRSRSPRNNRYERDRDYDDLYKKDDYSAESRNSRGYPALKREIQDLLRIEHHHIAYEGEEDSNGDIQGVEWCYKYLDPSIRGHITGGRAILHHRCRQCNRICLHLLGTYGTGKRMCLGCAARERGWREDEVPLWYYHKTGPCQHCRSRQGYYNDY